MPIYPSFLIYKTTGLPKDFKIFGSNDGSTWTELLDISGLTSGGVKG